MGDNFWIGNPALALVLSNVGGQVHLEPMAEDGNQFWTWDQNGHLIAVGSNLALTAANAGSAPTLEAPAVGDARQNWSLSDDGRLISGSHQVLAAPAGTQPGGTPTLVPDSQPVAAESTWQFVPVPSLPNKYGYNEFLSFLPTDRFRILTPDGTQALASSAVPSLPYSFAAILVPVGNDPCQIWRFEASTGRLFNEAGLVLAYYPYTVAGVFAFGSQVGPSYPDPLSAWILTDGYIWNSANFDNSDHHGDQALTVGDPVGLSSPSLSDKNQVWSVQLVDAASALTSTGGALQLTDNPSGFLLITVVTGLGSFDGTASDVHVSAQGQAADGTRVSIANRSFPGVTWGETVQVGAQITRAQLASIDQVVLRSDMRSSTFWPWPVEDNWFVQSVVMHFNDTSKNELSVSGLWVDSTGKTVTVSNGNWKTVDGAIPVDKAQCAFAVRWPQYLIDCAPYLGRTSEFPYIYLKEMENFPWGRDYDPTKIAGIGVLLGRIRGQFVGEQLSTNTSEVLAAGKYTYAYSSRQNAIIYKFYSSDGSPPANYVRHSQLASGQEVVMAGEFIIAYQISFGTVVDSVIVEVNNASGHYVPDNADCLYWLQQKLADLGISVENIKWWTPS